MVTKTPQEVYRGGLPLNLAYKPVPADAQVLAEEMRAETSAVGDRVAAIEAQDLDDRVTAVEALAVFGQVPKEGVAVATTANITLSGEQTIDGVMTSTSRVLVKDQTAPAENGAYISAAGPWSRASDMDAAGEVQGSSVYVFAGTVNAGATYFTGSAVATLGTDAIEFRVIRDDSGIEARVESVEDVIDTDVAALVRTVTPRTSANLYDPDIADSYDNGTYNTAGSVADIAKYHRSGLVAVSPGQELIIDIRACPADWTIYRPSNIEQIHGYGAGTPSIGNLDQMIPADFSADFRTVKLTVPASGVTHIAWSTRDIVGTAPTAHDFAIMRSTTALYEGSELRDFVPYMPANSYEPTARTDAGIAVIAGADVYVRQPFRPGWHQVRKLAVGAAQSTASNGAFDIVSARAIPAWTAGADTATAYAASIEYLLSAADNNAPEKRNGEIGGGLHGFAYAYPLTKVDHGLTATDVGDEGPDGAAKDFVLVRVVDEDTIMVVPSNTGTATAWLSQGAPTGNTITFGAAGAYTFTGTPDATQVWPALQDLSHRILVDGVQRRADGVYPFQRFEVQESYGIANKAAWLSTLISEKGTSSPKTPADPSLATQIEVTQTIAFDRFGGMSRRFDHYAVQAYTRLAGSGYFGAMQCNFPVIGSGETPKIYVPDLSGSVDGYDFSAIADVSTWSAEVNVEVSDCDDTDDPASHFAAIVADSGGDNRLGMVMAYARDFGAGVPAVRAAQTDRVIKFGPTARKFYPYLTNSGGGTAVAAGEQVPTITLESYYHMGDRPTHTINQCWEMPDGSVYWLFDIKETVTAAWIPVPDGLAGRGIEVIDSKTLTVISTMVTPKGIRVTTTGGKGWVAARLR